MRKLFFLLPLMNLLSSCWIQPPFIEPEVAEIYYYPFVSEVSNPHISLLLETDGSKEITIDDIEIPFLKYNKELLLMLTQDDCRQDSYCCTWAKFNGYPVSDPNGKYFYTSDQLRAGDIHSSTLKPTSPLSITDGTGRDIRFTFSTTLLSEAKSMKFYGDIKNNSTVNDYRFYMHETLNWHDVVDMLNYGNGIAFHDVLASNVNDETDVLNHIRLSQDSTMKYLKGRGVKFLAEPNGNKVYLSASAQYPQIKTTTAQSGNILTLFPYRLTSDLQNATIKRIFYDNTEQIKSHILEQVALQKADRLAISLGIHGIDNSYLDFFSWLEQNFGKSGNDILWMPSQEEYYEYIYYKFNSHISIKKINQSQYQINIDLPTQDYFYFPSITLNIKGLKRSMVTSISTNKVATGFSYADYQHGLMMNIDCRKSLDSHATHYVDEYLKDKNNVSKRNDAYYFVNFLKESQKKTELLNKLK